MYSIYMMTFVIDKWPFPIDIIHNRSSDIGSCTWTTTTVGNPMLYHLSHHHHHPHPYDPILLLIIDLRSIFRVRRDEMRWDHRQGKEARRPNWRHLVETFVWCLLCSVHYSVSFKEEQHLKQVIISCWAVDTVKSIYLRIYHRTNVDNCHLPSHSSNNNQRGFFLVLFFWFFSFAIK